MRMDDLKAAVQSSLSEDFDAAFARFSRERGSSDLMEFLLDLVEKDVLQPPALEAINAALPLLEDGTLSNAASEPETGTLEKPVPAAPSATPGPAPARAPTPPPAPPRSGDGAAEATAEGDPRATGERRRTRRTDPGITQEGPPSSTGTGAGDDERRRTRRPPSGEEAAGRRRASTRQASQSGKVGRGYEFIGNVGEGAMGKVVLAKDLDLQRTVAYKEMSEEIRRNKVLAAKFYAEAQITAQLDHPNIVPIYSLEETEQGSLAYSMKLIKGKTMEKLIEECWKFYDEKKKLDEAHSLTTRLEQFLKVCDALHYAHSRGVVHRDLKPENIMIGPYGEVYVMDWGIAKAIEPPPGKTPTGWVTLEEKQKAEGEIIIGTPQYMSPEQADGVTEGLTAASDQYSLGLILYELVSLRQAVSGKSPMAIITRQTEGDKDPLKHYAGDKIAPELKAIIEKATRKKIEDRYKDVHDLAEDIRRFLRGEAVLAKPDTIFQKLLRWMSNHRELTLLGILAGFTFFAVLTAGSQIWYQAQRIQAAQREEALTQVLTRVGTQAAIIDGNFVRYEGLLGVLAASSVEMLSRLTVPEATIHMASDFDHMVVSDLQDSTYYGQKISLEHPVNWLAKGADETSAMADLKRLESLGRYQKTILLRSKSEEAATYTGARADRLLKDIGVPIAWSHVGLANGAYTGYPGHGGYPDTFDAREMPWYTLAKSEKVPKWGAPYIDPTGLGLILPCARALYDAEEKFLGVAAIELTFKFVIEELLEIPELKNASEAFLLNEKGEVVIRSSKKDTEYRGSARVRTIRMPEFDEAEVVEKIKDRESGYIETDDGDLVVYQRMSTLGWYYVVSGESSGLLWGAEGQ